LRETPSSSCKLYKARLPVAIALGAEYVNRTPGLILWNFNYVRKVVFSLEILPDIVFEVAKDEMIGIVGSEAALHRVLDACMLRVSVVSNGTSSDTVHFHLLTEIVLSRMEHRRWS
jgi:hypothetical protein